MTVHGRHLPMPVDCVVGIDDLGCEGALVYLDPTQFPELLLELENRTHWCHIATLYFMVFGECLGEYEGQVCLGAAYCDGDVETLSIAPFSSSEERRVFLMAVGGMKETLATRSVA